MIVHTHEGTQMIVLNQHESDWFHRSGGTPEQPLINWTIQELVPKHDMFIDVGAHCGTWALQIAPHMKCTLAVEAQRSTFYQLAGGIVLNGLDGRIVARHEALTDLGAPPFIDLNITTPDGGGSTLDLALAHRLSSNPKRELVRTQNLDSDIGLVPGRVLIKIDVEGHELKVLKGGRAFLRHHQPTILVEVWNADWYKDAREEFFAFVEHELHYRAVPVTWPDTYLLEPVL